MSESIKELRAIFKPKYQRAFLGLIKQSLKLDNQGVADMIGVSRRAVSDWQVEKFSIPLVAVKNLCKKAKLGVPKEIETRDRYWYTHGGGNAGGVEVYKKYGYIGGDPEYRKKKWYEWWDEKGKFNKNAITATLPIHIPRQSADLAEFFGILLGDGGISRRQVTVTVHKIDDKKYADYIKNLIKRLFKIVPSFYLSKKDNVIDIVVSRSELVKFLVNSGLPIGSKVRHQVDVPQWIKRSDKFSASCIRGLFDTDGCLYTDKHLIRGKSYLNCGMNFTNRSIPLLNFFRSKLEKLGYHPTQKTQFSIFLRREQEILRYFKEIGSKNFKCNNKLNEFLKYKYGEVPKWS
ncbi:MAG: hypothetical protein UW79_C0005G0051 [Candidatus Yanofskybacteria bacterium GW2011_GWA2_44_9]|uniref:DOD-type homing endonuclease domain-containing protein n=1 Tax=Candidatus Yanofskybacteria bacterium GW2011_GWA2_44_9 TaxID=1619025 RepID=A0A0G1KFJ8_9BACT|nr:MAG: hypothetical protein UW79_C0005G0051 [Candidatus Yanofskybacteria bacterium GW2011_GWA2_44_9]